MSETPIAPGQRSTAARAANPGALLLARGIPAIAIGLLTTFTGGHSPLFGLVAVGIWGIVAGLAEGILVLRQPSARWRTLELVRAVVVAATGVLAITVTSTAAPAALVYLVAGGALVWGGLDLAAGLVGRGIAPLAREYVLDGGLTLLLGVLSLIVPPSYSQAFPGADGHAGVLTASTTVVGFFGAWGIVIGVLSLIAAAGWLAPGGRR